MVLVELDLDEEEINRLDNDSVGKEILRSILDKHDYSTTPVMTTTESSSGK